MRARGRDLQDVVLVEELDPHLDAVGDLENPGAQSTGRSDGPSPARRSLTWLFRNRATLSPIAIGLAIVVGTSYLSIVQQERERMAALADVPGVLRAIDGPVTELWRMGADTDGMFINGLTGFGGRLLLTENSMGGKVDVVALDARTGEEAWRVPAAQDVAKDDSGASTFLGGANCAFPGATPGSEDAKQATVVACVVTDETISVPSDNDIVGEMIVGTRAHLLVIDATTGAVVSQAATDPTSSVALLGADLITGQFAADGRVQVTRSGARDGTLGWTFTSPDPVSSDASGQRSVWVWASEGYIGVTSQAAIGDDGLPLGGSSWLLSPDGAVVRTHVAGPGDDFSSLGVLRGGSMFVESITTATGTRASVLTDAATGSTVTVEATSTGARPDDGSLGDAILMQSETDGALLAYDLTTKQPRWTGTASDDGGGFPIVLDGRVVRSGFSGSGSDGSMSVDITAVHARTGKTLWSMSVKSNQSGSLVTDGRLLLVSGSESTAGLGAVITAYDLVDGQRRWEVPIDEEQWLLEVDGRLFGLSGMGLLVAYGEP